MRAGTALFTAHTNAYAADPGVLDALAAALGIEVTGFVGLPTSRRSTRS